MTRNEWVKEQDRLVEGIKAREVLLAYTSPDPYNSPEVEEVLKQGMAKLQGQLREHRLNYFQLVDGAELIYRGESL